MSKYGWICPAAEDALNRAVEQRVLRWAALRTEWFPGTVKSKLENELIQYLVVCQNNPGQNDTKLIGLIKSIVQERKNAIVRKEVHTLSALQPGRQLVPYPAYYTLAQLERSRSHKYQGSQHLRYAIEAFTNQKVEDLDGMRPRSLHGHVRMKARAKDLKAFMKEVQLRYEVVDRAYNAKVIRKNGRVDRVSK